MSALCSGEISVVVGARSALFLPYPDLGLIIVDEEHDPAYKQEDGVHYHARDMAIVRAHGAKIPVILSSATPSVETEVNARRNRYARLKLPERFGGQHLPHVEAIDMRTEGPRARTLHRAAARRSGEVRAGEEGAGAAVPEPARLRAADAVPLLRLSPRLPELRCLAGRSPVQAAAGLPSLRLLDAAAEDLPAMQRGGFVRAGRSRRRAPAGRSRGAVSRTRAPSCSPAT